MRHFQKAGLSWSAFALTLVIGSGQALADKQLRSPPSKDDTQGQEEQRGMREDTATPKDDREGQQGKEIGQQCAGSEEKPYSIAPLGGGAPSPAKARFGAGIGGEGAQAGGQPSPVVAPVPQYWVADAALFVGNAANAAHVLRMEENLNVQAPAVLGDHASFLLSATNRALSSLMQLQQSGESTDPNAAPAVRAAIGHLIAAKATAAQAAEAVNSGTLGPTFQTNIRASLDHLAGAEKAIQKVGRAYGAPQIATASVCSAGRAAAFGAGLGKGAPRGGQKGGEQKSVTPPQEPQQPQQPQQPQEPAPPK